MLFCKSGPGCEFTTLQYEGKRSYFYPTTEALTQSAQM